MCTLGNGLECNKINNVVDIASIMKPTVDNTNTCRYLVKSVTYLLQYQNPGGIIDAAIDVEFFDSTSSLTTQFSSNVVSNVAQTFQTIYVSPDESIVSSPYVSLEKLRFTKVNNLFYKLKKNGFVYNEKLSGNPGYQVYKPLLAGRFTDGVLTYLAQDV